MRSMLFVNSNIFYSCTVRVKVITSIGLGE